MKRPAWAGKLVYFFGYPIFRILIRNTHRAYVVVVVGDTVLVTKNWLGFQKKWRLPGGGIMPNERPAVAACRELEEEVGIRVTEQQLVQLTMSPEESGFRYLYDLFLLPLDKAPSLRTDEREILEATFMSKEALNQGVVSEEVAVARKLIHW